MLSRPSSRLLLVLVCASPVTHAAVVTFEHAAQPSEVPGSLNVRPQDPYAEAGLTFVPVMAEAAIFSAFNSTYKMPGNGSDWFGFSPANRITVAATFGEAAFSIGSLRLGATTLGTNAAVNVSIVGHKADGSLLAQSFSNIATATTVTLGWSELKRIEISADDALGVDDIDVSVEPVPPLPSGHSVLRFEGVTSPGRTGNFADNVVYVNPDAPYRESGYRIVTSVPQSGSVTDGTSILNLVGEATDWLGFTADNSLTLTREDGDGVFDLEALEAGPLQNDFDFFPAADVTLTGTKVDGSTISETFSGLATATRLVVGWKGLTSLLVTSTQLAGIDNVEVSVVPEPSTWMTLAGGLGGLSWAAARNTRRRRAERPA